MLKRILVPLAFLVLGLVAGAFFGYRFMVRPYVWLGSIGRSFTVNQYALMQAREAAYPDAKEALEGYIRYLNSSKPVADPCLNGESPWFDARGLRFDKTIAWVRLAVLHEKYGNAGAAEVAWREVDALAAQGAWRDRSRQHFRDLLAGMDRAYPTPAPKITEKSGGA